MIEEFRFPSDQYLLLGRVAKAQGLRGEVKLTLFSGQPDNLGEYRELHLVDQRGVMSGPFTVLRHRIQGKAVIVHLDTIDDRNGAEGIEGRGVLLAKDQLPELAEDEYYWHRLIGKTVVDVGGTTVGIVRRLFDNGAQDVLVVSAGKREILIPMTRSIVVGETETTVIVDPPQGLLELGNDQ